MEEYVRSLYLTDCSNMLLALHSATNWLMLVFFALKIFCLIARILDFIIGRNGIAYVAFCIWKIYSFSNARHILGSKIFIVAHFNFGRRAKAYANRSTACGGAPFKIFCAQISH